MTFVFTHCIKFSFLKIFYTTLYLSSSTCWVNFIYLMNSSLIWESMRLPLGHTCQPVTTENITSCWSQSCWITPSNCIIEFSIIWPAGHLFPFFFVLFFSDTLDFPVMKISGQHSSPSHERHLCLTSWNGFYRCLLQFAYWILEACINFNSYKRYMTSCIVSYFQII